MTQQDTVLNLVKDYAPVRTEGIKRLAMHYGISCPDRYLRYLQRDNKVYSIKREGDKTKTWCMV